MKKESMKKTIKLYSNDVTIDFNESNHGYYIHDYDNLTLKGEPKKRRLRGVTTYLNIINKPALLPWAVNKTVEYLQDNLYILQNGQNVNVQEILYGASKAAEKEKLEAANTGTLIHKWIENFIVNANVDMPEDEKILEGVLSFLKWKEENKVEFIEAEKIVYSKKYDYVGTFDIKAKVNGKLCLIDIKTSNGIYEEVKLQTAAYVKADEEENNIKYDGRYVLRISKESEAEYIQRMEKKKKIEYPKYTSFEFIYLDEEKDFLENDFKAFISCVNLVQWKNKAKL